jgi:multidrug efflux pump subunit AcrB
MQTNELKDFFDGLDFDLEDPAQGHEERFRQKLKQKRSESLRPRANHLWQPLLAVAASFLLGIMLLKGSSASAFLKEQDLAAISPEMEMTQEYYISEIAMNLENLQAYKNPKTEIIINDALDQLKALERDYLVLMEDLKKSGQDQRVVNAMIFNLQKRMDLLKTVGQQLQTFNHLNTFPNENFTI